MYLYIHKYIYILYRSYLSIHPSVCIYIYITSIHLCIYPSIYVNCGPANKDDPRTKSMAVLASVPFLIL